MSTIPIDLQFLMDNFADGIDIAIPAYLKRRDILNAMFESDWHKILRRNSEERSQKFLLNLSISNDKYYAAQTLEKFLEGADKIEINKLLMQKPKGDTTGPITLRWLIGSYQRDTVFALLSKAKELGVDLNSCFNYSDYINGKANNSQHSILSAYISNRVNFYRKTIFFNDESQEKDFNCVRHLLSIGKIFDKNTSVQLMKIEYDNQLKKWLDFFIDEVNVQPSEILKHTRQIAKNTLTHETFSYINAKVAKQAMLNVMGQQPGALH